MTFDNFLSEQHQAWRDTCHRFMDQEITREYIRKCDMDRAYYYEGYEKVLRQGWLGLMIPEEHGGIGGDAMAWTLFFEAMGKYSNDFSASTLGTSMYTSHNLIHYGTPEQRKKFLEPYLRGDLRFCISISEPHSGSDAANVRTRAERDGDHYVLHGLKQWCSGSGAKGAVMCMLVRHLELERLSIAGSMIGCAQQAVTDALAYAHQREQFGQPIFNFQVLKHMLADMQTRVDAGRLMVYRSAGLYAAGQPCLREVSMAKLMTAEVLQEVSRNGVQIMGGFGMLPEADMERYFREGMQATVGGGTSQIMRTIIAQTMKL
jgi:alkylation response protein AidB-like acyl-CoA dehydrogenase